VNDAHGNRRRAEENAAVASHAPVAEEPDERHAHAAGAGELGPIDWPAWIAGGLGVVAGLVVIAALYLAGRGG
jgi:hypothetical protein